MSNRSRTRHGRSEPRSRRLWRSRSARFVVLLLAMYLVVAAYAPEYAGAAVVLTAALPVTLRVTRWWHQFRRKRTLADLVELSPTEFELEITRLLVKQGFRGVRRTGGAGDLNADIVGYDPKGRSVVVQCKRYRPGRGIGSEAIQTFIGMQRIHHQSERGIFITTGSFTRPARELAAQHGITLVDGEELARLLAQGGQAKWARENVAGISLRE